MKCSKYILALAFTSMSTLGSCGDDFLGNFIEERFSLIYQDSIDEISESPIGRVFTVHKVFIADIDFAIVFQLSERDASFIHKPEQNRFQHIDGIISDSSQLMSRKFAQIFA